MIATIQELKYNLNIEQTYTEEDAYLLQLLEVSEQSVFNYLDKTKNRELNGYHPPLTVKFSEMINFIKITHLNNEHVLAFSPEKIICKYKSGDKVRVVDGEFKGVVGRVARVAGQQRIVVEIEGLCVIATAYVPSSFIRPI